MSIQKCLTQVKSVAGWVVWMTWLAPAPVSSQVATGVAEPAPILLNESGMLREFDIVLDEVSIKRGEQRETRQLAAANPIEWLAKVRVTRAQERALNPLVEVEPVVCERGVPHTKLTRKFVTRKLEVKCQPGADAQAIMASVGLVLEAEPGYAPGWVIAGAETPEDALDAMVRLRTHPDVLAADVMLARWRIKRSVPNDPLFPQQWNLRNAAQGGGALWIDANVTSVWNGFRGTGITIGIIDDGLQHTHPDLQTNYNPALGYDFNGGDGDPAPGDLTTDSHGTACAGVAAARGDNSLGGCGVAYESTLAGFRLIAAPNTDQNEADAFSIHPTAIQIKSSSWGGPDDGRSLEGPGPLAAAALANGTATGRGGKGTIYVFAGGNGFGEGDNSNYDGYTNSIHTLAVGALNDYGFQSYYSEPGANLHVCAPSDGGLHNQAVITTDLIGSYGANSTGSADLPDRNYTKWFGGTSAAAPMVAGIAALMLQANPQLGWRDVQEILMRSARQVHHADPDWEVNGAGICFNHKYGAGLVDAQAAVGMAQDWLNLGPQSFVQVVQAGLPVVIPDDMAAGINRTFNVTAPALRVEHVTVTLDISHANRGDLEIVLTSPSGMVSRLAEQHGDPGDNYANWTFSSVRHWGETAAGDWNLRISDRRPGTGGTLAAATLRIYGSTAGGPRVVPGNVTVVAESNLPANSAADPGERLSCGIGLQNPTALPLVDLTATLLNLGGVSAAGAPQAYGDLAAGGAVVSRIFDFIAGGANGTATKLVFRLEAAGNFIGYATTQVTLGVKTVVTQTGGRVTINDHNTASPFPAILNATGHTGRVHNIRATLSGFSHERPHDLTVFLGGPAALNIALFSIADGAAVTTRNFTFDDNAPVLFPDASTAASGSYRPWDASGFVTGNPGHLTSEPVEDERGYALGEFNGLNPNGPWRLYVEDSTAGNAGVIEGWSIAVTTVDCTDNIHLVSAAQAAGENAGALQVVATRTGGREGSATIQYVTAPGSATAGVDYTHVSGMVTFAPGEATRAFGIPILNDSVAEGDETIQVALLYPDGNSTLGSSATATLTIQDDDRTEWQSWQLAWFGSIANGGDGDDLNDFDHDGIANLLEFAFGLDPTRHSAGQLPQAVRSGGNLTVSFSQPVGVSGITYGAEWSESMLPGSWIAVPDAPVGDWHSFSVPSLDRKRLFLRLRASRE